MSYRDESKKQYSPGADPVQIEDINCGSFQRIADACEKMAASYDTMRMERDTWKRRFEAEAEKSGRLAFSIRSLRGVITKLKAAADSLGSAK